MANYADGLVEGYNAETTFFYASPMGSLRADGELFSTADIKEAYEFLNWYTEKGTKDSIIFGAVPFCSTDKAQLILPKNIFNAGPTALSPRLMSPVTLGARVVAQRPTPEKFISNVESALLLFNTTPLRKVVLSRMIEIVADKCIDIKELILNLLAINRLSRVFALVNKLEQNGSVLVGASPEIIISKRGLTIQSNPLAGSIARSKDPIEDYYRGKSLLSSEKDMFEHRLVISAIAEKLQPLCSTLYVPNSPSLISTPKMWHLSTRIKGTLYDSKMDALTIARILHPTPAVCGHPTELAMKSIQNLEGYDRELYTGIVGWMNKDGDGEWALAIRCAKVLEKSIYLYAGAGIVEGSDPQKELAETVSKFGTLTDVLGIEIQ